MTASLCGGHQIFTSLYETFYLILFLIPVFFFFCICGRMPFALMDSAVIFGSFDQLKMIVYGWQRRKWQTKIKSALSQIKCVRWHVGLNAAVGNALKI